MATSRTAMTATGSHQRIPSTTSATMADSTTTLSASGSRKAPERVAPCFRAIQPSNPSDSAIAAPSEKAAQLAPQRRMRATKTGVPASLTAVTALAGVSRAEGPNVCTRPCPSGRTAAAVCISPALLMAAGPRRSRELACDGHGNWHAGSWQLGCHGHDTGRRCSRPRAGRPLRMACANRTRTALVRRNVTSGTSASAGRDGIEVGAGRPRDEDLRERSDPEVRGDVNDPVHLGRFAVAACLAGPDDQDLEHLPDEGVTATGSDAVLELRAFEEPLGDQLGGDLAGEIGGLGPFLAAVREEADPVELCLLQPFEQQVVVGLGL